MKVPVFAMSGSTAVVAHSYPKSPSTVPKYRGIRYEILLYLKLFSDVISTYWGTWILRVIYLRLRYSTSGVLRLLKPCPRDVRMWYTVSYGYRSPPRPNESSN